MAQTITSTATDAVSAVTNSAMTAASAGLNNMMDKITKSAVDAVRKRINDAMAKLFGDTNINSKDYIFKSDFDSEFITTLQSLALQAGDAFLNGLDTSAFAPPSEESVEDAMRYAERAAQDMKKTIETTNDPEAAKNAAKGFASNMLMSSGVGGNVAGVMSAVSLVKDTNWDAAGEQAVKFAQEAPKILAEVTKKAVVGVTKKLTIYTTTRLTEILDPTVLTVAITYYTTYYMTTSLKGATDLLKQAMMPVEEILNQKREESQNKKKTEKQEKLQKKLADIKETTQTVISYVTDGINAAKPYIKQGPDALIKVANSYIRKEVDKALSYVDQGADYVIKMRDKYIQEIGELAGTKLAESINNTSEKLLKKQQQKSNEKIKTIMFKAIGLIMTPIQLLISKVGPLLGKIIKMAVQIAIKMLIQEAQKAIQKATQKAIESITSAATAK